MQGSNGPEVAQATARQELQLTQAALARNPKAYGSWHHRKWIIQMQLVPLDEELLLVKQWVPDSLHAYNIRFFHAFSFHLAADIRASISTSCHLWASLHVSILHCCQDSFKKLCHTTMQAADGRLPQLSWLGILALAVQLHGPVS